MRAGGQLREQLRTALRSIWAHRLRSVLTVLGIIIGVASVITVVHLTKSLEARIMADVRQEGTHTFFLSPWVPKAWREGKRICPRPLDEEQVQELRELVPEIVLASPDRYIYGSQNIAKAGPVTRRVIVHAMDENGLDLSNQELAAGRGFTATDRMTRAPVVVLGTKMAQELGFSEGELGRTFTLGGITAEVVGILKKHGDMPFTPDDEDAAWGPDNEVYIPIGSFKELSPPWYPVNTSYRLQVDPSLPLPEAQARLHAALRRIRGLRGDDPDNFDLSTNEKQVAMVEKVTRSLMLAAGGMVSISLLVGGIGVMNIMLVSVSERTREIGVRKALGARRRTVLAQFLIEAMALCLVGGALGAVLGLGLGSLLSRWLLQHLGPVPPWSLLVAILVPAAIGLAFGLYPAARAAKMDPIEALRYE